MPNIEVHGFGDKSEKMRAKIVDALSKHPRPEETVTTVFPSVATTLLGSTAPYLRIIASPASIGGLVEMLKPLGEDIEVIPLGQWIPKEKEGD